MRPIARGDRGKEVVDIQMRLSGLGYSLGREGADGYFGQQSERAIKGFQQERLLAVDGVVGENTWTELVEAGRRVPETRHSLGRGAHLLPLLPAWPPAPGSNGGCLLSPHPPRPLGSHQHQLRRGPHLERSADPSGWNAPHNHSFGPGSSVPAPPTEPYRISAGGPG